MKLKAAALCLLFLLVSVGTAQVRPVNDYGALGIGQLLKQIGTTKSVMMIGAHPDDEDSALLAYLARGENARTAYLSLTRGDGGQNIIGPELFEPLGIIRTEELLQARRLDGAEQYFTRAFDYGFSKTLAEAKSKWPEDVIRCDAVRAVRLFRPLVVISRFTGTPADGHGQHQYAGYITPSVVDAAADPQQCQWAGETWRVRKFYVESSFNDTATPTLRINTGQYDPLLGRTYFEIAMEGRSLHRSQGEGRIEFHGEQYSGLNLVGAAKDARETTIFDGLDVSIAGIRELAGSDEAGFNGRLAEVVRQYNMSEVVDLSNPSTLVPKLAALYKAAYDAEWSSRRPQSKFYMRDLERRVAKAFRIAAGIQIDALADAETAAPGQDLLVSVKAFVPKCTATMVDEIALEKPAGWIVDKAAAPTQGNAAFNSREIAQGAAVYKVTIPRDEASSQPYWLRSERKGDLFAWPAEVAGHTYPFEDPDMFARIKVKVGENVVNLDEPVRYRFADPARGELRRNVDVVPSLSVETDRSLLVVPTSSKLQTRTIVVTVTNNLNREQVGNVSLKISSNPQWKVDGRNGSSFKLATRGAKASVPFDITIPANTSAGRVAINASATVDGASASATMNVVAYPHIQTHRYYTPADVSVETIDLQTTKVRVGYVMGSGDEVPEAIRQMGLDVTMLAEQDLSSGDLSKFDTIVVGIRASETRPDLVANNTRLLDFARAGGTVIFQYQRGNWTGLAPYPVNTQDKQGTAAGSIARVVDENAAVTILDASNPIFNSPNKITSKDFEGWVQERNAYNLVTFDPQYTPLLESHDADEQENKGGLVIAKVGKGNWVYCSYSFFRQLPAGVPGAYRLFANLLSLGRP